MATSDIQKFSVYDSRIVQSQAKYAVDKGALSISNTSFAAISASQSQHTYNITVPSQNVFIDRAIDWSSEVLMSMDVTIATAGTAGDAIVVFGRDVSLCALPLNSLVATASASINDTSVVMNSQDVLKEVLRLTDYKRNRLVRTAPNMLDRFATYNAGYQAIASPMNSYDDMTEYAEVPNGAYWNVVFTRAGGAAAGTGAYAPPTGDAYAFSASGVPVLVTGTLSGTFKIYFMWATTEKLVLSPFIFADSLEYSTGLFGINNMQLIMNLRAGSEVSRVIRNCTGAGRVISNVALENFTSTGTPFANAKVNVLFLTPSLDMKLPEKSVVPYYEFPRYISNSYSAMAPNAIVPLVSNNIVLPQVPDMLLIYAKPRTLPATGDYTTNCAADFYFPIRKISINWDNFSGLLSSHTREELYQISVHNGLEVDYNTWCGKAHSAGSFNSNSGVVPLVGGPLVLKFGQDIPLQTSVAPGLLGNFNLQYTVEVENQTSETLTPQLYTVTCNSGYFESLAGSSRIVRGVSESEIISAPMVDDRESLQRMVGGGFFGRLGNILSKAKDIYSAVKPGSDIGKAVSGVKGALPEGMLKNVLGQVGYGSGTTGGARGKKSLESRLM